MRKRTFEHAAALVMTTALSFMLLTGCSGLGLDGQAANTAAAGNNNQDGTVKVERGDISVTINGAGIFQPAKSMSLFYQDISGSLKNLYIKTGDKVTAGQPIAEINSQALVLQIEKQGLGLQLSKLSKLQNAEMLLTSNRRLQLAQMDLDAAKKLYKEKPTEDNSISLTRYTLLLEQAKSENKISQWNVQKSDIQYKLDERNLADLTTKLAECKLTSTVDGIAIFVEKLSETELVNSGRVIARIAEPKKIVFKMLTPDAQYYQGKISASLTIGNSKYDVSLYTPEPGDQLDQNAGAGTANSLYLSFNSTTPEITLNQSIEAGLELKKSNVPLVPRSAVYEQNGKSMVDVFKGGLVESMEITRGMQDDSMVEVISGLKDGSSVVTR